MTRARFLLLALALLGLGRPCSAQRLTRNDVLASDGQRLVLWSKSPSTSAKGEIVLLHGRTWSARPNFDLHVAGQRVSLMDALVARGYAVYALDQRGYGATARDASGWLTPERAAADAESVLDWVVARSARLRRPALLGYSRGSATAMLAAQRHPEKLSTLIMYGPYHNVEHPPEIPAEPASPPRERTTADGAAEDFISPESTPAGVKDAYVKSAMALDPVRVDWRHEEQFNALNPAELHTPTLVIHGERDPYAAGAGMPVFFSRIASVDHAWVVLAGTDHVAHLERQGAFVQAIVAFLEREPRR
ncbi:MAG: lysophospholipase [Gemmatimonadota bacterium]|nr:lysophospholipase [Gemmatimonadota bacterium]